MNISVNIVVLIAIVPLAILLGVVCGMLLARAAGDNYRKILRKAESIQASTDAALEKAKVLTKQSSALFESTTDIRKCGNKMRDAILAIPQNAQLGTHGELLNQLAVEWLLHNVAAYEAMRATLSPDET